MSSWCLRRGRAAEEKWWWGRRTPLSSVFGQPWLTPEPLAGFEIVRCRRPRHPTTRSSIHLRPYICGRTVAAYFHSPPVALFLIFSCGARFCFPLVFIISEIWWHWILREEVPEAFDSCGIPTHLVGSATSGWASTLFIKTILSFIYLSNFGARVLASVRLLLKFQRISVLPKKY
ncbi:hypothetical protein VPH35_125314 [Triticum aestivum]